MDHETIAETNAAERYLLNEMSAEEREQFEAHFFECTACADEVRSGEMFVANSRAVFDEDNRAAERRPAVAVPDRVSARLPWWKAVFRPAWGIAAAGLLLALGLMRVGQVLPTGVTAHVLPAIALDPGPSRGDEPTADNYHPGDTVPLQLMIRAEHAAGAHVVEIRDTAEKMVAETRLNLTAADANTVKEVRFSGKGISAGPYVAVLRPMNGSERGKEIGRYYFKLNP